MSLMHDQVRFSITVPYWYERKLRLWAALKGTNRATLAGNILQARVEANWADVDKEISAVASHLGVGKDQLESSWLQEDSAKDEQSEPKHATI